MTPARQLIRDEAAGRLVRRITSRKAAERIGIATATLANKRSRGEGPPGWLRLSRTLIVYDEELVDRWISERAAANAKPEAT